LNEPDENQKSAADGNVKYVNDCQHVCRCKNAKKFPTMGVSRNHVLDIP
jgi:hypothetical protein